jgi:hypothetical protein
MKLSEGGQFVLNFYESIDDTTSYGSYTVDGPRIGGGFGFIRPTSVDLTGEHFDGELLWEDFEGKISIYIISGVLKLTALDVQVEIDQYLWGDTFSTDTFQISSVPVPSSALLLFSGLLGLAKVNQWCIFSILAATERKSPL